ncbi:relaxase/mobilization nuclease domain-containing protein [Chitinophaga sp. 30R24]|uniref:relaxase/mobilization nuclease domain-containing protein n=1 Tax=Chitinophaga sp. 30R24 TaxID=3248838 RepID=UPI003B91CF1E
MVAVINASRSLSNVLHYNENKVKQSVAELIHSKNYAKDTERLGFTDKIRTLQRLTELNTRTKVNSIHISLNFDPSENIDNSTLQKIADQYMQKIGFGEQPYLVYKHTDASHPHIHIVTTNIQRNGKRIELHNIGKIKSEPARKEIENMFQLVKADLRRCNRRYEIKPINSEKVIYGKSAKSGTKRAITNVLDNVLPKYKYTSLPELNAILRQYNVLADQGGKESRIYKNGGLVYRVLNERGDKVGVPIPASHIYNKPTLKKLQQYFEVNHGLRNKYKMRMQNAVDFAIAKRPGLSVADLKDSLHKEKINLVIRQNDQGIIYGLTYVDHLTKCVFNGSDLGKPYSANRIQERCKKSILPTQQQGMPQLEAEQSNTIVSAVESLFAPEKEATPGSEFDERKRKRRKRFFH